MEPATRRWPGCWNLQGAWRLCQLRRLLVTRAAWRRHQATTRSIGGFHDASTGVATCATVCVKPGGCTIVVDGGIEGLPLKCVAADYPRCETATAAQAYVNSLRRPLNSWFWPHRSSRSWRRDQRAPSRAKQSPPSGRSVCALAGVSADPANVFARKRGHLPTCLPRGTCCRVNRGCLWSTARPIFQLRAAAARFTLRGVQSAAHIAHTRGCGLLGMHRFSLLLRAGTGCV